MIERAKLGQSSHCSVTMNFGNPSLAVQSRFNDFRFLVSIETAPPGDTSLELSFRQQHQKESLPSAGAPFFQTAAGEH